MTKSLHYMYFVIFIMHPGAYGAAGLYSRGKNHCAVFDEAIVRQKKNKKRLTLITTEETKHIRSKFQTFSQCNG